MVRHVVKYGHPVLRQKGRKVERIADVAVLIDDMLETMKAARGVGLAAQQVGEALQLTVIDVREVTDRPSTLYLNGEEAPVESLMPLVLINPEVSPAGDPETGPEGCLSFPEMYAEITRPGMVDVRATNEQGGTIEFRCGGLLARAVQHEVDHLNGILFIDRMTAKAKQELKPELEALQAETKERLEKEGRKRA